MVDTKNKKIKSYVLRKNNLSQKQDLLYHKLAKIYLEKSKIKNNDKELILDIGIGIGTSTILYAKNNPKSCVIGVEVYLPGVLQCMQNATQEEIDNIKLYAQDVNTVLSEFIENNSISKAFIFYPDPWHKQKHKKRRLINLNFLQLLNKKLKKNALLHIKTDWEDYAQKTKQLLESLNFFIKENKDPLNITTKFKEKGIAKGLSTFDLIYKKVS